jgi:hypothetical protein
MVEKIELLPLLLEPAGPPPAPTVTIYGVPSVAVKAASTDPPPPESFGVGVGAEEV